MCVYLKTDNKLTQMTKPMTMSRSMAQSACNIEYSGRKLIVTIFRQFYLVTCLVPRLFNRTPCATSHTASYWRRVDFFPVPFTSKEMLAGEILHPPLFIYGSIYVIFIIKREFYLATCVFEKTALLHQRALFHTQLSTYSRHFMTSVEHENSAERDISDLSTDFSFSLSTVYNLGPRSSCDSRHVRCSHICHQGSTKQQRSPPAAPSPKTMSKSLCACSTVLYANTQFVELIKRIN